MSDAYRRAYALCQANDAHRAMPFVELALQERPDDFRTWCVASWACNDTGRFQRARDSAEEAIRLQPESEWAHRSLARALQHLGHRAGAMEAMREAVRVAPNEPLAWRQFSETASILGFPTEAASAARRTVELEPEHARSWTVLGFALRDLDWEGAFEAYHRSLALAPESPWTLNALAWLLIQRVRFDEALDLLERALRINPEFTPPLFNRALITSCVDGLEAGEAEYTRAVKQSLAACDAQIAKAPREAVWYGRRARHLRYLGDEHGALESARKGVRLAPSSVEPWRLFAWLALNLGRFQLARYAMRRALENDPSSPALWSDASEIACHSSREAETRHWATRVIEEAPDCQWRTRAEGVIAFVDGDFLRAAETYRRIVSVDPYHCCYQNYLATCLLELGDHDGARRAVEKADLRSPNCRCATRRRTDEALARHRNATGSAGGEPGAATSAPGGTPPTAG